MSTDEPTRRDNTVYSCLLLLGIGILLPWNALITAADYFERKYPGRHADRMFSICYLPAQLVTLLLVTAFHTRLVRLSRQRILFGFCGFSAVMVAVATVEIAARGASSFVAILLLVVATGVLDGVAQGALYGEFSHLPPVYTQGIVTGTALSGAAISALRVVTKASFSDTDRGLTIENRGQEAYIADLYFALAAMICVLCVVVCASILPRQPLVTASLKSEKQPLTSSTSQNNEPRSSSSELELCSSDPDPAMQDGREGAQEAGLLVPADAKPADPASVVRQIWPFTASLVVIYILTLSIFPGFLVEDINSSQLGSWYPVLLIAAYNLADLVGKWLPASCHGPFARGRGQLVLASSLARVLFVPAFYASAKYGAGALVIVLLTLLLGASNGFLTAVALTRGPTLLETAAEKNLAGNIAVLAMISGLTVGAVCSFLWLV